MVTLNTGYDPYKVYLYDLNYDVDISKNTLVCGKRGSGKTFLFNSLIRKLVGSKEKGIKKEVTDNHKICYIKQGDYINGDKLTKCLEGYISRRKEKLQECCKLFRENLNDIDDDSIPKEHDKCKISNYLKSFIEDNLLSNINENIKDKCISLKAIDKKFENFINYNKDKPYGSNYKICENFINKVEELIRDFSDNKDVLNSNDGKIQESINNFLKEIKPTFDEKLEKMYLAKEIENFRIEIYEEINETIINKDWKYTFNNFDFFNYFKVKKINELYESFINESNDEFISCSNDGMYGFKHKIELDSNDFFSIKSLKEIVLYIKSSSLTKEVEASPGQEKEFLILKELERSDWNFFMFDEPEYSFDNVFLKNKFAKKINSILQDDSKKCWIITHNHVLWSEIFGRIVKNKSYMLCNFDNGIRKYEQKTDEKDCDFMKIYEADDQSYSLRKEIYKKKYIRKIYKKLRR